MKSVKGTENGWPKCLVNPALQIAVDLDCLMEPLRVTGLQTYKVNVTPELVKRWNKLQTDLGQKDRPVRKANLQKYMNAMLTGRWQDNGATIAFTINGHRNDGQHRLRAVELLNRPQALRVAFDAESGSYGSVDTGGKRTEADRLAFGGFDNTKLRAAWSEVIYKIECGKDVHADEFERERIRKQYDDAIQWGLEHRLGKPYHVASIMGPLVFAAYSHEEAMTTFVEQLRSGAGFSETSPALAFQKYVAGWGVGRRPVLEVVAKTLRAAEAFVRGKELSRVGSGDSGVKFFLRAMSKGSK